MKNVVDLPMFKKSISRSKFLKDIEVKVKIKVAHLVGLADLGGDDVIEEPVDRLVVVKHQEELDENWQAEIKRRTLRVPGSL